MSCPVVRPDIRVSSNKAHNELHNMGLIVLFHKMTYVSQATTESHLTSNPKLPNDLAMGAGRWVCCSRENRSRVGVARRWAPKCGGVSEGGANPRRSWPGPSPPGGSSTTPGPDTR